MQQHQDHSTDEKAVLADHLIKRWKLVFITQERIKKTVCDLNKQRKKNIFNLVEFGAIFYWERVSQISIWHQNWLIISWKETAVDFSRSHFILGTWKIVFERPLAFGKDMWLLLNNGITYKSKINRMSKILICLLSPLRRPQFQMAYQEGCGVPLSLSCLNCEIKFPSYCLPNFI